MRARFGLFILVAAAILPGAAWAADPCNVSQAEITNAGSYASAIKNSIGAIADCDGAYRRFEACSLGTSGDNAISDIVRAKCEKRFLPTADAATKKAYKDKLYHCDDVARKNSGTMYLSLAALCRAKTARDFARKSEGVRAK